MAKRSCQKNAKPNGRPIRIVLAVLAVSLLLAAIVVLIVVLQGGKRDEALEAGVSYIQTLESRNTAEIESAINALHASEVPSSADPSGDSSDSAVETGGVPAVTGKEWEQLEAKDTVIMGDSRAVGFYFYEFMQESSTITAGGATIRDIPKHLDTLSSRSPKNVVLCYGLNDISIGFWSTPQEYTKELGEAVQKIRKATNNATVYVNSTIPAIDPAFELASVWRKIPEWNVKIKKYCEETGIRYIDINNVIDAHPDLYEADGIHMNHAFYPYWGAAILAEVNKDA